jgi:hypothetical protein
MEASRASFGLEPISNRDRSPLATDARDWASRQSMPPFPEPEGAHASWRARQACNGTERLLRVSRAMQVVESKMQRWASRGVAAGGSEAATKPVQFSPLQRGPEPCIGTGLRLAVEPNPHIEGPIDWQGHGNPQLGRTSCWCDAGLLVL